MSNNAASNVIAMREFDRAAPSQQAAQFERLLKECQDLALERLSRSVSGMLDKAEETLWGLANQAMGREVRDLYIHVKDLALAQCKRIESEFRASYLAEFESRTRRDKKAKEAFSQFELGTLELGLVNNEDLEETLKVNDMAAKLRRYCEEELAALDQRIGVVMGDATLQGETNPFSPQAICSAFKQTCRGLELSMKARMVLHKLFDDHVLDDIRPIFKDLNNLLVERSILPKIRYGVARHSAGGMVGVRAGAAAAAAAALGSGVDAIGAPAAYPAAAPGEQDMFAMLQNLVAMNLGAAPGGVASMPAAVLGPGAEGIPAGGVAGGVAIPASGITGRAIGANGAAGGIPVAPGLAAGGVPAGGVTPIPGFPPIMAGAPATALAGAVRVLQGAELLSSLTRIQHGDVSVVAGGDLPLAATLVQPGTTNVLRELKGTSFASGMEQMDSMTLDIVAMLFDQIFGDENIPIAMKGLIGRLQIPMLKVAILDKNFFSKKAHPARRLLDVLGEIAVGLNAEFDQASPLYKHIDKVVQRLVDGFQDSMDIFDPLRAELEAFIAEENRRAEEEARINARRIEHREKLEIAKGIAQQEILQRAKSGTIPRAVLKFLVEQWVKLLLVAHAKHGEASVAWKSAVETMDLLIWSVNAKQTLEERRRLAALLPGLLKRLNAGMQLVSTDEETRKRFFAKLMRCHTKVMNTTAGAHDTRGASAAVTAAGALAAALDSASHAASPGEASSADAPLPVLTEAVTAPLESFDFSDLSAAPTANAPTPAAAASAVPFDEDTEPAAAPPEFAAVTIQNPFGDGDIEVEEISMPDLPTPGGPSGAADSASGGDEHSRLVKGLKEGVWIEFRDDDDNRRPARLSYISPLKGTYLFVNRQGKKVGEYSVYQLAREFRSGRASLLDAVPLFDRAMGSLVGALRATAAPA